MPFPLVDFHSWQQDTEQANAAEDFQTIVMNALRDTLGLTDSQAAESSPAATPEE